MGGVVFGIAEDCCGWKLVIVSLSLLKLSVGMIKLLALCSVFSGSFSSLSIGLSVACNFEFSDGTNSGLLIGTSSDGGSGVVLAFSRPQPPIFFFGPLHMTILSLLSGVSFTAVSSELTLFVDLLTLSKQFPLLV